MSLDLTLSTPKCNFCGNYEVKFEGNYTYNIAPMWYEMFPDDDGILPIEGMTGLKSQPIIKKAINEMIRKKKFMVTLEPKNGWGSYIGFLDFLNQIYRASLDYPDSIWSADR